MRYLSHDIIYICSFLNLTLFKNESMKKLFLIVVVYLELWGVLGFFATIILSFLSCCIGLSKETYLTSLGVFAFIAIAMTLKSTIKRYSELSS